MKKKSSTSSAPFSPFLVRLETTTKQRLDKYRDAHGVSAHFIVNQAIRNWLDANEEKK